MKTIELNYDVCVIGGGMAGVCAAIAAARNGMKTALVQDRMVLGGNASSEVRMHICGATRHWNKPGLREGGIIEELLLENKSKNPEHSFAIFDTVLWEKVMAEKNIDLYLNCYAMDSTTDGRCVKTVTAKQTTTEKTFIFSAKQFIDCSGDGLVSAIAGADYMFGREGKAVFNEPGAVDESDEITMGNSIQFHTIKADKEVPFKRPDWAYDYKDDAWVKRMKWDEITSGYWWIEVGGLDMHVVDDAELTRDDMLKIVFGIWDYIKNHSIRKEEAKNYYIDWVSYLPAKRESRRFVGDYVLKEQDILEKKTFDDAVAYGGWHLDDHIPGGFYDLINNEEWGKDESKSPAMITGVYQIPYRCLYSKDFDNLFFGGRLISTSHRAFSSTRVIATCAVVGHAVGVASAFAIKNNVSAADVKNYMTELQQELIKEDCYIPNLKNEDEADMARKATVSATSEKEKAINVINGITRALDGESNVWESDEADTSPALTLKWDKQINVNEVRLIFDSDFNKEIMISISDWCKVKQSRFSPATLVKDYTVQFKLNGETVYEKQVNGNYQRLNVLDTDNVLCDELSIVVNSVIDSETARIFEVRVY